MAWTELIELTYPSDTVWKVCPDYPTIEISDKGRFRRISGGGIPNGFCRNVRLTVGAGGYHVLHIKKPDGVYALVRAHTLVGLTYLGVCPEGQEIRHKDRNRLNDRPSNLEYSTHKESMRKGYDLAAWNKKGRNRKLTLIQVAEIRASTLPMKDLVQRYKVSRSTITAIRKRKIYND